jgi:glyceraldehyde-3-phosphate dehydrogenase (NADP+)
MNPSKDLEDLVLTSEDQIPQPFRPSFTDQRTYLCDGRMIPWSGPQTPVSSPIHMAGDGGSPEPVSLGRVPDLDAGRALECLEAAHRAYDHGRGPWPTLPVAERLGHMEDFVHRMVARKDQVVRLIMWEICKSRKDAEKEFTRTVQYIRDTIDALKDLDRASSRFVFQEGILAQIRRAPLGVALCMGPFNYPLNETFATLIPALLMGNTVVFKPPKHGCLLYEPLLEAFRDAFPPGVVNMVTGAGSRVIPPLMESGKVNVFAFIGTSRVANSLRQRHPKLNRLRCVLGLEAKNPAIVLPDADLEVTVRECVLGGLSFNGQRCTALKIFFVHKTLAERFVRDLSDAVSAAPVGLPWQDPLITPLAEPGKPDHLASLIQDALALGARVTNEGGGSRHYSAFRPAVVYPVDARMRLFHEEQFGPVLPVVPYEDLEEPVRAVIESPYGQQLSLFGTDPQRMARLIDPLVNQVCRVNLNCQCQRGPDTFPFTGRKDSAESTLSVADALRAFSIRTLVAARDDEADKALIRTILRERLSRFLSTDFLL